MTPFKIRPWAITDLDSLVQYANNWNVAKNLTNKFPFPYTEKDGRSFIALANQDNPVHLFAIEVASQAAGGIGIHPQADIYEKNAELGYWLAEPFWGQGIVMRAIPEILDFAFSTYLIDRIFARPFGTNLASQRVLERPGLCSKENSKKPFTKTVNISTNWYTPSGEKIGHHPLPDHYSCLVSRLYSELKVPLSHPP